MTLFRQETRKSFSAVQDVHILVQIVLYNPGRNILRCTIVTITYQLSRWLNQSHENNAVEWMKDYITKWESAHNPVTMKTPEHWRVILRHAPLVSIFGKRQQMTITWQNFGSVCQTVQPRERWQTQTHTHRQDRLYTLNHWRGKDKHTRGLPPSSTLAIPYNYQAINMTKDTISLGTAWSMFCLHCSGDQVVTSTMNVLWDIFSFAVFFS